MRTRLLMHENMQFRKFLKRNGVSPAAVISHEADVDGEGLTQFVEEISNANLEESFRMLSKSLKDEQSRAKNLAASLYVLQIDYNELLLESMSKSSRKKRNTSPIKRPAGRK